MRRTLIALVFIVACRTHSTTQPLIPGFGPGTDELVAKTRVLNDAFLSRNEKALDELLAPEFQFHYIDHNVRGVMQATPNAPRGKWPVEMLNRLQIVPMSSAIVDVRVYGDVGIVVSHYNWMQYEGYMNDIWIRRGGKWQLLIANADVLPTL